MYEDADGDWRIVDYKTNRLEGRSLPEVARPYELQLAVYALATEQILGVTPRELVLWFLDAEEEYVVDWNASARKGCVSAVNRAIARLVSG
jgi:ATP-dependent exoDNAse (exonuclease V) beta subunit